MLRMGDPRDVHIYTTANAQRFLPCKNFKFYFIKVLTRSVIVGCFAR